MQLRFLADTFDFNYFWASIIQIGIIGALILLGNVIRRKTPFLRSYLVPTGLIAGFLGLAFKYIFFGLGWEISGTPIINEEYMHYLTYHSLALGFIALGITSAAKKTVKDGRALKSGILIVGGYLIQGIVGVLLSLGVGLIFVNYAIGKAPYAGILLPLGFGQGPGQAGNIGGVYETITGANALVGGRDFGLSVAAVGFILATIIGTIILNVVARKKLVVRYGSETTETFGDLEKSNYQVDQVGEIPVVESVDKFTIQAAFVLATYLITFGVISFISYLVVDLAGIVAVRGIIWGFNFLFAILVTMVIKVVLNRLRKSGLMKRQYINNYMQNRIAGLMFDFMITTGIISINFGKLNDPSFWVLLALMAVVGTVVTYFYINIMTKKYFAKTRWYTFFGFFGMLTGTASEGVALLREIDPHLKTGVAEDIVNGSGMAAIFGAPMLVITTFIYQGTMWFWISFALLVVLFVVMILFIHLYSKRIDRVNAQ